MKYYPTGDRITYEERKQLGLSLGEASTFRPFTAQGVHVAAVRTGETRPPRRGEWYLSGAIVEAYRAPNDLSTPYHIARLVKIERRVTERLVLLKVV